ncbi:hypothetical protein BH23ACT9_BH23ACT9_09390 [soil metagenome]
MNGLFEVALEVQRFCDRRGWRFCFIGGLAVQRWGEPRQTRDVDLTLLTGFGQEEPFIDALLDGFAGRVDDARSFALRHRVLLLRSESGVGIDVALGGLDFEEAAVAEATGWRVGEDRFLRTCSAEALVVYKAFAGRPQDWLDVEMVVARQGADLDADRIISDVAPLLELKDAVADLDRLRSLLGDR